MDYSCALLPRFIQVPSKPSSYVVSILKPLAALEEVEPVHKLQWIGRIVETVTERLLTVVCNPHKLNPLLFSASLDYLFRYDVITDEVLTSVKRTEESLLKLKQSRRSSSLMADVPSGMSDDNKIRLQLALDIEQYSHKVGGNILEKLNLLIVFSLNRNLQQVESWLPGASSLPALATLLEMAATAKTAVATMS